MYRKSFWLCALIIVILFTILSGIKQRSERETVQDDLVPDESAFDKEVHFRETEESVIFSEGDSVSGDAESVMPGEEQKIRVVLNTDGYQSLIHTFVSVTSDQDFTAVCGSQREVYPAGTKLVIDPGDSGSWQNLTDEDGITIETVNPGKIQMLSMNRSCGHPSYRGKIHVWRRDQGLICVNELPLEEYLYGVLPSEMPESFGLEALKAQAVCARSFACSAIGQAKYQDYHADVDDSTACQVYMNSGEDETAIQAVDDTCGEVLYCDDEIADTYFYSTSCGVTSDVRDVWGGDQAVAYLQPVLLEQNQAVPVLAAQEKGLSGEVTFRNFIDLMDGQTYFEEDSAWFRWQVILTDQNLVKGFSEVSEAYKSGNVSGRILGVEVTQRGSSGIAKKIQILSEGGSAQVNGEYSIRRALRISGQDIRCLNGQTINNQIMLPSGYFYVTYEDGSWMARGGGYGHGVGMSQNGAAAMCALGMTYKDVLNCFYPKTQIRRAMKDASINT